MAWLINHSAVIRRMDRSTINNLVTWKFTRRLDDFDNLLKKVISHWRTGGSNKSRTRVSVDPVYNAIGSFKASLLGMTDKDAVDEGGDEVVFIGSVSTKGMEPSGSVHSESEVDR